VRFDCVARFIENPNHGNHVSGCFASRNRLPRSRRRMRTTNFPGGEIRGNVQRGGGTVRWRVIAESGKVLRALCPFPVRASGFTGDDSPSGKKAGLELLQASSLVLTPTSPL
jgi:hypothetical protein